jgi:predicted ATP-grasp superfamily ATP-dependent carboligase
MGNWLLISYHVPAEPSALRVAAWRALKQMGAVSLGAGLYALPNTPEFVDGVKKLGERIAEGGGTTVKFSASPLTEGDQASLGDLFMAARTDEFRQAAKGARRLVEHIQREREGEDFRFAEVESLEEELEKVRRQFERVVARDHFGTPAKEEALTELMEAERSLRDYMDAAYEKENRP